MDGYITDLRDDDVLLGRGSGPNDHEGNIRFRNLVAERKTEYMATNHRLTKARIAQEIVDKVFANHGRFLRRLENDELARFDVPDGVDAWMLASEETIMEKAKQALRQNTNKTRPGLLSGDDPKAKLSPRRLSPKPAPTASSSPVPTGSTSMSPVPLAAAGPGMGRRQGRPHTISVPRLDDFEPIPLDQAYPPPPPSNMVPPNLTRQQQVPAPSSGQTSSHDSYRQALAQTGRPKVAPAAGAPSRVELSPPPPATLHSGPRMAGPSTSSPVDQPPVMMTAPPQRADTLDLQDDSILAHLPAHVRAQFLRGAHAIASVESGNDGGGFNDDGGMAPLSATVGARNSSNQSMEQIPLDEDLYESGDAVGGVPRAGGSGATQRLASMDMTDLARYHGRRERYQASEDNMSVVVDSFSKLRASGDDAGTTASSGRYRYYNRRWSNQTTESERNRMLASTDTMGTIEPIGVGSMADMSFATMNSSTFSIYRGNDGSPGMSEMGPSEGGGVPRVVVGQSDPSSYMGTGADNDAASAASPVGSGPAAHRQQQQQPMPPATGRFDTSFSHAELPISRTAVRYQQQQQQLLTSPQWQNEIIREDHEEAYDGVGGHLGLAAATAASPHPPMPNRLMEDDPTGGDLGIDGMGLSSMELLKSAFHSSTDWDIPPVQQPIPPAPSDPDPPYQQPSQHRQPPPTA